MDYNRSKIMWVTDMAVMPNAHKMVLAFTDNMLGELVLFTVPHALNEHVLFSISAAVYDLSTPAFEKQFQITALPYCALVLHHL